MKRFSKLLLLLLIGVIPFVAKASEIKYEAIITSDKGAKYCEDYKLTKSCKTLEKDSKVTIFKDEEGFYMADINNSYVYIEPKTFKPVETEITYNEKIDWCDGREECIEEVVETRKEVELKKGPDSVFETITTIPKGTKLKFRYYDYDDGVEGIPTQLYVTYDNKSGWVSTEDNSILFDIHEKMVYVNFSEVKIDNYTIPRYTYVLSKGFTDRSFLLDYKGNEIDVDPSSDKVWQAVKPAIVEAKKTIKVYEDTKKTKVIKTINVGDKFTMLTYSDNYSYTIHLIEVDGVKGFISYSLADEEKTIDFLDDKVDYESIGLGEFIDYYDPTKWVIDDNNNNVTETKKDNKANNKEEDTVDSKKVAIIIISIASVIIIAGLIIVFKK